MSTPLVYVREIPEYALDGLPCGRHVEHDDRSRGYAFEPGKLKGAPLRQVRHQRFIPVLDQGPRLGSCTGNAAEGVAGTGVVFQGIPDSVAAKPSTMDAGADEDQAVALYTVATVLDGIPGQYPPDDTGSTGLGAAKALLKAGLITGYQHTFSLIGALTALQLVPELWGVNWYDSFDQPDGNGLVTITPGAEVRGGHEIVADELLPDQKLVGFTNSWSDAWGFRGRFYVSFADLDRLLGEQGDVTVPVPLGQPAPQPAPVTPDAVDQAMWTAAQTWAQARGL